MTSNSPNASPRNLEEDDHMLLDDLGDIPSAQPTHTDNEEDRRLTPENFRIVRELSSEVRSLVSNRENLQHFSDNNLRLYEQGIRPRWLGRPLSPPILPGTAGMPHQFHQEWTATVKKFESKLQRKVLKYLPDILDGLNTSISKKRNTNLQNVLSRVQDTKPGQKRRGEVIYMRLCNRTERVPLPNHRSRRPRPAP